MAILEFLERNGLTQTQGALEAKVPIQTFNDIANRKRSPRLETITKVLRFARKYEPRIRFEDLFAPELLVGRERVA